MAFICLLCLTVSGTRARRTSRVKAIIAIPKFRNDHEYRRTSPLIMGWMITRFQASIITSKNSKSRL